MRFIVERVTVYGRTTHKVIDTLQAQGDPLATVARCDRSLDAQNIAHLLERHNALAGTEGGQS